MADDVATYSALELLKGGLRIEIRALRKGDTNDLLAAIGRASEQSRYLRFFGPKRHFSDKEIQYFTDPDFVDHVALVAVTEESGRPAIIGGARFIVIGPDQAELAFVVIDAYQGRGIGAVLLRHLATIARAAGLKQLVAEVLPDNAAMRRVFEKSGMHPRMKMQVGSVHIELDI